MCSYKLANRIHLSIEVYINVVRVTCCEGNSMAAVPPRIGTTEYSYHVSQRPFFQGQSGTLIDGVRDGFWSKLFNSLIGSILIKRHKYMGLGILCVMK